jgi:lipopolysaccharide biosynthesis glycosyltransferase
VPRELVGGLPGRGYIAPVVWYRIFMPQLLPDLARVLYVDADVIAMDGLEPLWATELGDHPFAAVTNIVPEYFQHRAAELGLPGPQHYFNAGIVLWNLTQLRREPFLEQVLAYAREHMERLLWLEQDILNALYWRRRLPLHPRWNAQNGIFYAAWGTRLLDPQELAEAREHPALLHFEGGSFGKPWHILCAHPLRARYFFHRRRTPWPWVRREGFNARDFAIRFLPPAVLERLRQLVRRLRVVRRRKNR